MNIEELVRTVVAEVLLQQQTAKNQELLKESTKYKFLIVFTGGAIGVPTSLSEVKKLKEAACDMHVVLTTTAEKIIGIDRVTKELGSDIKILTSAAAFQGAIVREADLVCVPILTQNSMAKIALTIADTPATTYIMQALMLGKKVIAAKNAADPHDAMRKELGMGHSSSALMKALQSNMVKVQSYGIKLVDVNVLATKAYEMLKESNEQLPPSCQGIISAAIVRDFALNDKNKLVVGKGAILTPLAKDIALECGIKIVYE